MKWRPAQLILASGEKFSGEVPDWQSDVVFGEVVFNTGMVGYVECLTDPSYCGQLLSFTYPLIGNYGVPDKTHWESGQINARAMIVSQAMDFYARTDAAQSVLAWCQQQNCAVLSGVDTRALTKVLRTKGTIAGAIVPDGQNSPTAYPDINTTHLVKTVSIKTPTQIDQGEKKVIVIDCGMKENIWRLLQQQPITLKRVPFDYDFNHEDFDGVFISNGPGDPQVCQETINIVKRAMQEKPNIPIFGICLGAQIMALAIGAKTYKLPFGHRSQNQPCHQLDTERCFLTSQNHGYAIAEASLPSGWYVSFRNLNDDSVQGIAHQHKPYFAVQFHPEAAPGPTDTRWLFDQFYQSLC